MKTLKITSISVLILGIIHLAATPLIILPIFKSFDLMFTLSYLYMFIITGVATVLVGWVQLLALKKWLIDQSFHTLFKVCLIFIIILGLGAVASMWKNPFAYLALIIAIIQWIVFIKTRFRNR